MTPCPKPRPRALEKQDAQRDLAAEDRRQRAICRQRSGGICEVTEHKLAVGGAVGHSYWTTSRCHRRATENHHLLGGIGVRNKGRSILAAHRIDVCEACHRDITQHVLQPIGREREYALCVLFERQR